MLFRTLATLRTDIPLFDDVEQLRWNGPTAAFEALGSRLDKAKTAPGSQAMGWKEKSCRAFCLVSGISHGFAMTKGYAR